MDYTIQHMFPQPLMVSQLINHKRHKEVIMDLIQDCAEVYPFRKETKGNLFRMEEFKLLENDLMILCEEYFNVVCGIEVKKEDFFINSSWLNNFRTRLKLVDHAHHNAHISGCYYVNYNKDQHPPLVFRKPSKFVDCNVSCMVGSCWQDKMTDYNKSMHVYTPEEGEVCLFNSNIVHEHNENKSSQNRISIAFNCVLRHYRTSKLDSDDGHRYEIFIKEIP